jgi:hypothetical protein
MTADFRRWTAPLLLAAILAAGPARAAALGEPQVRAFVAAQQRSWNAGDLAGFFAMFRPEAVFTDQFRTPAGEIVPYGSSTLAQARAQSRRFRATLKISEAGKIVSITFGPDARSAQVVSRVVSQIQGPKGARRTCAERRQRLVLAAGGLRSEGQTDTFSRCPR